MEKKGFVSYAHDDAELVRMFRQDLAGLEHDYPVTFWIDPKLRAGDKWRDGIAASIAGADIVLLLMSRAFLASTFIRNTEWPLIQHREQVARIPVIPVILEECRWRTTWGAYQATPHDGQDVRPIVAWNPVTEGCHRAAQQIEDVLVDRLRLKPKALAAPADLRTLRQDPAGPLFLQRDQQFQIDESTDPSDQAIAADPDNARRLSDLHAMADRLVATLAQRDPETMPGNLLRDMRSLAELLDPGRGEAWSRIGAVFDRLRALGRDVESLRTQVDARRNEPSLDRADIDALAALVDEAMFCALQFPSVQRRVGQAILPEALDNIRPLLPTLVEGARALGVLSTDAALALEVVLENAAATPADQRWAVLGMRNLLYRVGGFATGFVPNPAVPGRAEDARLMRAAERFLRHHGAAIETVVAAGPAPVRGSFARLIKVVVEEGLRTPVQTAPTVVAPGAVLPDDFMDQVKAMILRGEAPPAAWVPFITRLEISEPEGFMPGKERLALSDLRPLSGLTALTSLDLRGTQVSDVGPLSGLTALTSLDLWRTQVSDVGPLSGLTALTSLDLGGTPVSDVGPLSGLTALTSLDLGGTPVSDVGPLSGLTALTSLDLGGTQVSDVGPLSGLTALTSLGLRATQVDDVGPLSGLTALTSLDLGGTQVSDVGPLSGLTALTSLDLAGTHVGDVGPLSGLTALTSLDLASTQVGDVGPLAALTALTSLDLASTQVGDVGPLAALTALTSLDLWHTEVRDVDPLSGLTALTSLNLSRTQVTGLGPLSGLTVLASLNIWGTPVRDMTPLSALTNLRDLYVSSDSSLDLSPLEQLINVQVIRIGTRPGPPPRRFDNR